MYCIYFLSLNKLNKMVCDNDKIKLKTKAVEKPSTLKPSTILVQIKIINALITNKNKPNVKNVIGKVNNFINGFTVIFKIANAKATFAEVAMPSNSTTPSTYRAIITTNIVVINNRAKSFMI